MSRRRVKAAIVGEPEVYEQGRERLRNVVVDFTFPTLTEEHHVPTRKHATNPLVQGALPLAGWSGVKLEAVKLPRRVVKQLGGLPDDDKLMGAAISEHGRALLAHLEAERRGAT